MKFTIGNKVATLSLVLTVLIVTAGLAGLNGVNQLSDSLNFIRGSAWNAADGAMEGTIELQSELLAAANIYTGALDEKQGLAAIEQAESNAREAFDRMIASGLIDNSRTDALNRQLEQLRTDQHRVIQTFTELNRLQRQISSAVSEIDGVLMDVEDTIEQSMDGNALLSLNPQQVQTLWDAADATMEARIGLLSSSHAASQVSSGKDFEANRKTIEEGLKLAGEQVEVLKQSPLLQRINANREQLTSLISSRFEEASGFYREWMKIYPDYLQQKLAVETQTRELRKLLALIEESGDSKVENAMQDIDASVSLAYNTVIAVIIIGIAVAIGASLTSLQMIAKPIAGVAKTLHNIAENGGDLTQQIDVRGHDEIAELASGFNLFMQRTRDIINQVKDSAGQVSNEAGALNDIIQQTSQGALNQKAETEQVASAVTELVSTVSSVATHASDAASISQNANDSTREGKALVRETVGKIQQLAAEMSSATNVIHQVQSEADNIGGVLDVIQGIAEQTNLLALNAAIEAARAGEQGRGFAVVADEVRTLASRTQESTTEIKAMIETLQTGSRNAVDAITRSHNQTNESADSATRADAALDRIVEAISDILAINEQIAVATNQQEIASKQIGASAENIHGIAESTAHKAEQAMASTHQLAERAVSMTGLVSQFRT